jgi:hypothetical protein
MSDDLVKRIDSLMVLLNMEREKSLSLGKHIEKLEAALFNIYAAPNDIPFIKAQIDAVLDINEYRQAMKEEG